MRLEGGLLVTGGERLRGGLRIFREGGLRLVAGGGGGLSLRLGAGGGERLRAGGTRTAGDMRRGDGLGGGDLLTPGGVGL